MAQQHDLITPLIEGMSDQFRTSYREDALKNHLLEQLTLLRQEYAKDRSSLSEDLLGFLENIEHFVTRLDFFKKVLQEKEEVVDMDDFEEVMAKLNTLRTEFEGLAMEKRVAREIRDLQGKIHLFRQVSARRKRSNRSMLLARIEGEGPKCQFGHPMTLRQGNQDWFWGCRSFPSCWSRRKPTKKHRELLAKLDD